MVHLSTRRLASVIVLSLLLAVLTSCGHRNETRRAVAEANLLSNTMYSIEIVGQNGLAMLAYRSDILHIDQKAQWDGIATIGAYNLAFQQRCQSLFSPNIQAKQWRGKWVQSNNTSPQVQVQMWLQLCAEGRGSISDDPVTAGSVPVFASTDTRSILTAEIKNAPLDWDALCDAHLDSIFGTQAYLTDIKKATVVLYFNANSLRLVAATFAAEQDGTTIYGIIRLSAIGGQTIKEFPPEDAIEEGVLSEEWDIIG